MSLNLGLRGQLLLICVFSCLLAGMTFALVFWMTDDSLGSMLFAWLTSLLVAVLAAGWLFRSVADNFRMFRLGLLNFKDFEFSSSLAVSGSDEFAELAQLYNEVGENLRREKQAIYQRELLLDKVIQSSPIATVLTDDSHNIIYSNSAARHLLNQGQRMEGSDFSMLQAQQQESLNQAIEAGRDGLFSLLQEEESQTWHLSRGRFLLNSQYHHLYLFKHLTRELNRQEVAVWKKVIRVISHELNNSLAPMSSMTHSGKIITERLGDDKLALIFRTIEERVEHLNGFIQDYARFAKLPLPQAESVDWQQLVSALGQQMPFGIDGRLPDEPGWFDRRQLEQVLINLLKNAGESGSRPDEITLAVRREGRGFEIRVCDRGAGMSDKVLQHALLPFYSTKQSGTGLGLALCREIVDAHEGRLAFHNRQGGGLQVSLWLPGEQQQAVG